MLSYQVPNILGDEFHLFLADSHAFFFKQREALRLLTKQLPNEEERHLLELMVAARGIQSSAFMYEPTQTGLGGDKRFDPVTGKRMISPSRVYMYWEHLQGIREAIPRVAKFLADYERIKRGQMPVAAGVDIEGLSPIDAAGKIMREVIVDYGAVSPAFRRNISGLFFPFGTWYIKNGERIYNLLTRRDPAHPDDRWYALAKIIVPLALLWMWNQQFGDVEENLPEWLQEYPMKLITGYKSEDGKPIVWILQDPASMAAGWIGMQRLPYYMGQLWRGTSTLGQVASQLTKDMIAAVPIAAIAVAGPTAEGFLGERFDKLKQPLLQVVEGIYANRNPFTRRTIVPDDVERWDFMATKELPKTPNGRNLLWRFVFETMIAPYAQYMRASRSLESGETLTKWFTTGPFDVPRAFGRREVNVEAVKWQRQHERLLYHEGMYRQKFYEIENAHFDWVAGELTADEREAKFKEIALRPGPQPTPEAVSNWLGRPRVIRAMVDLALKAPSISNIAPRLPAEMRKKLGEVRDEDAKRKVLIEFRRQIDEWAKAEYLKGVPVVLRPFINIPIPRGIFPELEEGEIPVRPDTGGDLPQSLPGLPPLPQNLPVPPGRQ